jgi:hypothetical protein
MRLKRPSHATVVAYLALIVALGGSAYAVNKVGSRDIADNSVRSRDLRNGDAVRGRDVREDSLTGKVIREKSLDASGFTAVARDGGGTCDPTGEQPILCAQAIINLPHSARMFLIGTGDFFSEGGPALSHCFAQFDGGRVLGDTTPGEIAMDNTDAGGAESFTVTGLSEVVPAGPHSVSLNCGQVSGDAQISQPVISAIALGDEP